MPYGKCLNAPHIHGTCRSDGNIAMVSCINYKYNSYCCSMQISANEIGDIKMSYVLVRSGDQKSSDI